MRTTIQEAQQDYDLELDKIIGSIKNSKAKVVLLQFPDNMKPYAPAVVEYLENRTNSEIMVWFGSCWGACDIPRVDSTRVKIDLIVQFGHSAYNPKSGKAIFN